MELKSAEVRQNLIDAGCSKDTITRFFESRSQQERLRILDKQRKQLLEIYHSDAQKIDRLDFLVYQLKKENNG